MSSQNHTARDLALSPEERAAIDAMFKRLGGTYYEILGVPRSCDQAALRAAYGGLCGRFHPELFEGMDLGRHQAVIEAIFREVTNAFEVLCRPDLRAIYDQSLPPPTRAEAQSVVPPTQTPTQPRAPLGVQPEARAPTPTVRPSGPVSRSVTPPPGAMAEPPGTRSSPSRGVAPAPPPRASELPPPQVLPTEPTPFRAPGPVLPVPGTLKRTPTAALINGGLSATVKRTPTGHTAAPPEPTTRRPPPLTPTADLEATRASLARSRVEAMILQKRKQREELDESIAEATAKGDTRQVLQLLRHALTLYPDDESLQRRLQQAEASSDAQNVEKLSQQARGHERSGRWGAAAELWSKAAGLCPGEYSFHLYAAQAFCEAGTELPKAADLARKATRLRPDAVEAHVCLARVFFKSGRTASAKGAIEAALKLAPQNPAVIDLARQLRV